jgi:hypothetical protein
MHKKPNNSSLTLSFVIDEDQKAQLIAAASLEGETLSVLIRRFVRQGLARIQANENAAK